MNEKKKLLLRFTGMCAFVPKHENGSENQVRVLLADMSEGARQRQGGHAGHGEPHYPVLIAYADTFGVPPSEPEKEIKIGPDVTFRKRRDQEMGLIYLQGQDLKIQRAASCSLKIFKQDDYSTQDSRAFSWVASMPRINNPASTGSPDQGCAQVEQRALATEQVPRYIAARVGLTEGTLTNYAFAADSERLIVTWAFRRGDEDFPLNEFRPLSEEVQLEYYFDGDEVCFELADNIHARQRKQQTSVFCLQPRDGYNIVEAWVANVPLLQILERDYTASAPINVWMEEVRNSGLGTVEGDRNVEHHFSHFYQMLKSGRTMRLPYPHGRWRGPGGPSIESPRCPPVVLGANENA